MQVLIDEDRDIKRRQQKASAAKTFRLVHPERVAEARRNWRLKSPIKPLLAGARGRAKQRGLVFTVTEADLSPLPTHCPILGTKLSYARGTDGRPQDEAASLDRKDSSRGYVQGNVFIVSYRANMIKNCGSANEHRAIAEWMEK
jgi:hypothetical protein